MTCLFTLSLVDGMFDPTFEKSIQEKIGLLFSTEAFHGFEANAIQLHALTSFFRCGEFCIQTSIKYPSTVKQLLDRHGREADMSREEYLSQLQSRVENAGSFDALSETLRRFRYEQMLRIAWRDLLNQVDVEQTLKELSWLADACIVSSVTKLTHWAVDKYGQPVDENNCPLHLVTLAMGKLGADELNFSSDIDLIFCYPKDGTLRVNEKELSYSEFYTRLCQQLVRLLSENTAYGFVYRVDTRLRPFGNSGQLALSFDAMESYYERHGREWERYAMIKARPITADSVAAKTLCQILLPFVYRRYLDYSVFASLRDMKQMIDADVSRKGAEINVKLGLGGIREIEFIGQVFQLIRGGRSSALQQRGILTILSVLCEMGLISTRTFSRLHDAYLFLRKTENTIQAYAEQQTHVLPDDKLQQARLAYAMGFDEWASFSDVLNAHMQAVHVYFEEIFSSSELNSLDVKDTFVNEYAHIWRGTTDGAEAHALLLTAGYAEPKKALTRLRALSESSRYKTMGVSGKQRFDKLMPVLIPEVGKSDNADDCLLRIVRLLEAIAKRTAYLALLSEYPQGLSQLVKLFDKSPWIADLLVSHPVLLDELIDIRRLYEPMFKADLTEELGYILDMTSEDLERQVQRLTDFKQSNFLRVAASELMGVMPVEKVSDHLTYITETALDAVTELAINDLSRRYGRPTYLLNKTKHAAGFCVVAYGKLGGMELGFGSDLDLVFLHDSQGEQQATDGEKSLDNAVYYARLGQRIIRFLNTPTQGGRLYEVDMRLRPSGGAGVLVSSISSFFEYQKNKAWVWEHQALIRARFVSGSEHLRLAFSDIRERILCQQREAIELQKEVKNMRARMRNEQVKTKAAGFDLKQGVGGITDIEFIIQYLVLRWANTYPDIVAHTDNLSLLACLVKNALMSKDDAKMLGDAYLAYRHTVHQHALQGKNTVIASDAPFLQYRASVTQIWNDLMACD